MLRAAAARFVRRPHFLAGGFHGGGGHGGEEGGAADDAAEGDFEELGEVDGKSIKCCYLSFIWCSYSSFAQIPFRSFLFLLNLFHRVAAALEGGVSAKEVLY